MTGSLYAGMADHFFNNCIACIATNLFHVMTESGVVEMMIIRVAIAQLLSFAVIMLMWVKKKNLDNVKIGDIISLHCQDWRL